MRLMNNPDKFFFEKGMQAAAFICVYLLLCELYVGVVANKYSFGGFDLAQQSRHELVLPVLLLFLLIVPLNAQNMKSLFVLFSFFFLLIPAAVLCALQGSDFVAFIWMVLAVCAAAVFWNLCFSRPRVAKGRRVDIDRSVKPINFWLPFSVMSVVLMMLAIHVNFAFRYSFAEVYDYRFDFNDSLQFPLNYLLPFAGGPLAGFLAALAFSHRQWGKVALVVLCGVLFYGFSTHKALLFFPIFSVGIAYAIQTRIGMFYLVALTLGLLSAISLLAGDPVADILGAVFANRLIFIPAQIHYAFFEEFAKVGFLYWAESRVSLGLISSPIPLNSVNYIAEIMTGDASIGANVGWIANGFMNLGLFGITMYSAIIGLLLATIDRWSAQLGCPILVAAFCVPIFSIVTSSDLLVAMLTGGVLPMLVLVWLLLNLPRFSWR